MSFSRVRLIVLSLLAALPAAARAQEQPPAPALGSAPTAPAPAVPAPALPDKTSARLRYDKGFVLASDDDAFSLKINLKGQVRFEVGRPDAADEFQSRFFIRTMRAVLAGHAFGPATTYKVQFDFGNKGNPALKDFYIDHSLAPGVQLRAGQWKRPFSRQEIVSIYNLEAAERSTANQWIGAARDIGLALHNDYEKSPEGLEWAAGVFNASTADKSTQGLKCTDPTDATTCTPTAPTNVPSDWGPALVARVGWNHGHIKGYSEGDLEGGPLRFAIGASYQFDLNNFDKDAAGDTLLDHRFDIDAILKVEGFDLSGAVYLLKPGQADGQVGFYAQTGYLVLPERLEIGGRFSQIPAPRNADERQDEILGFVDVYFHGHSYKWVNDVGPVITTGTGGTTDWLARSQLQMVF